MNFDVDAKLNDVTSDSQLNSDSTKLLFWGVMPNRIRDVLQAVRWEVQSVWPLEVLSVQ